MAPPCVEVGWTRRIITCAGAGATGFYSSYPRYVRYLRRCPVAVTPPYTRDCVPWSLRTRPGKTGGIKTIDAGGQQGPQLAPMVHLVDDDERLLTVREVASVLGVSSRTVRRRIAAGMPIFRIGSSPRAAIRVSRGDLADYIASATVKVNRD